MPLIRSAIAGLKLIGVRRMKIRALLVAGALIISYGSFWSFPEKFATWNALIVDHLVRLQPRLNPATAPGKPAVILVDSIFYVSRTNHAQVIENLSAMKVAAQVIDFIFDGKVDAAEDRILIKAAGDAGNVYLGMAFKSLSERPAASEALSSPGSPVGGASTRWPVKVAGDPAALHAGSQPQLTYPELASVSGGLGFLNLTPDPDGVMFQFPRSLFLILCTLTLLLIGMGIEKALLFAESERARRIAERELEIGRDIQTGFFPTTLPTIPGWELQIHFQAARFVAGDFYDVFTLGPEKKIGIVVADVCDKGVGAALFMALFRSFIRVLSGQAVSANHLASNDDPAEILRRTIGSINDYISITHEQAGMFATIFFGILSPDSGRLDYINGGHDPAAIVARSGIKTWLKPTGPAVGLYPDFSHDVGQAILEPGDTLFVYSDGVIDALDKTGRAFTKERLASLLAEPFSSTAALIDRIKTRISAHIAGADQFDDITITALRRADQPVDPVGAAKVGKLFN